MSNNIKKNVPMYRKNKRFKSLNFFITYLKLFFKWLKTGSKNKWVIDDICNK